MLNKNKDCLFLSARGWVAGRSLERLFAKRNGPWTSSFEKKRSLGRTKVGPETFVPDFARGLPKMGASLLFAATL